MTQDPWPVSDDVLKANPDAAEAGLIASEPLRDFLRRAQRVQAAVDRILGEHAAQVKPLEASPEQMAQWGREAQARDSAEAEADDKAQARAMRAGRKGGFKSKLDERAFQAAVNLFDDVAAVTGKSKRPAAVKVRYEPLALTLHAEGRPLRSYRPDLMVTFTGPAGEPLNKPWLIEVKPRFNPKAGQGGKAGPNWRAHKSGRSSKLNLEHAAAEYAEAFRFFVLWPSKTSATGWEFMEVKADE